MLERTKEHYFYPGFFLSELGFVLLWHWSFQSEKLCFLLVTRHANHFIYLNCYCRWWPPILFLMQWQLITYIQLMFIPLFSLLQPLYPCHQMRFCAKVVEPCVKCCLWCRWALMHVPFMLKFSASKFSFHGLWFPL